jgi:serine protease Do
VILKFDGKAVNSSSDLPRIVGSDQAGKQVTMQVWRKGASREVSVVVGEIPKKRLPAAAAGGGKPAERAANRLGLVVSELTAEQKRELKVNGGLLIEDVRSNTARAELRPGDVILALISRGESTELSSAEQFNKLLGA